MADIDALFNERNTLLAEADRILDNAVREKRSNITAEEQQKFDRLQERAASLKQQIDGETARRTRTALPDDGVFLTDQGLHVGRYRGAGVFVNPGSDHAKRATPGYVARFMSAVFGTKSVAAVGLGTDPTDGGLYLAPPQFVVGLLKGLEDGNWFRALASVRPPSDASAVTQATRTAITQTFVWNEHIPDFDETKQPKFGSAQLIPHYLSGELEVARGVLGGPGGEAVIRAELIAAAAAVEERSFLTGDGQSKPVGLFHVAENGQGVGPAQDIPAAIDNADTYVDARMSLRSVYLRSPSLRWIMHPSAYKVAAKIKTTDGVRLITRAQRAGERDHIDGVPIEFSDDAPQGSGVNGAFEAGDYFAMIGDIKQYDIVDSLTLGLERHGDSVYAHRGAVGFIFRKKVDGNVRDADAFRRLKVPA